MSHLSAWSAGTLTCGCRHSLASVMQSRLFQSGRIYCRRVKAGANSLNLNSSQLYLAEILADSL